MRNRKKKGGINMCVPPSTAIDVIKATYNAGKKALEIAENLKNVELKEAILELKEANLLLREENIALKEQLKEKQKYNMVFEKDKYWNILPDGTKDGPYCAACWDYSGKAVHLDQGFSSPHCHICFGAKNKN